MPESDEALEESCRRIAEYGHGDPRDWVPDLPSPHLAVLNLARLLQVSSNPDTRLRVLAHHPALARRLLVLLGAGRRLPDVLLQNPELADWIIDPERPPQPPARHTVEEEARRQTQAAHSYSHRLDRLRYVKQKWTLAIAIADLEREWPARQVWSALSALALGLIAVAQDVVWRHYRTERDLGDVPCPIVPVALGKLGGEELNYSSDVDLIFVLDDDADESLEKHAQRYCEALRRALDEPMGRGPLYRVDLRLRPYGGVGPVAARWRALEAYYRRYAEPWEQLALVRSLPVLPSAEARWEILREEICFRASRGEWFFEEIVAMRARGEDFGPPDDLKRGPGGIRDVEMLVQSLQALAGHSHPELRVRSTLEALGRLAQSDLLPPQEARDLAQAYTLLRQAEHRCQILDDRQTHVLPAAEEDRLFVATSLGFPSVADLEAEIARTRRQVRAIYRRLMPGAPRREDPEPENGPLGLWLRRSADPDSLREALGAGGEAARRLITLAERAPRVAESLAGDAALTELVLSGEIEEAVDVAERFHQGDLARASCALHSIWATQRVLGRPAFDLTDVVDHQIVETCRRADLDLDIVALGSYAGHAVGYDSDADLLLLAPEGRSHAQAEEHARRLLAAIEEQHRAGSPLVLDLRLRPEGRKGALAIPAGGLEAYSGDAMEAWERFALGRARLVTGDPGALRRVAEAAYARPLEPRFLGDLLGMKARIETERVPPADRHRHVKLGLGGSTDLEWAVQLLILAHRREDPPASPDLPDRLDALVQHRIIDPEVGNALIEAWRWLDDLRFALQVAGHGDLVPEQPEARARLALEDAPEDLDARLEATFALVRSFYESTVRSLSS